MSNTATSTVVTTASRTVYLRCPGCVRKGRGGKIAMRVDDGCIEIVHGGRRYRLTEASGVSECFCENCKVWVVPVASFAEALPGDRLQGVA